MALPKAKATGFALLVLLGLAAPLQAQTTLRYKFKEGDKLSYVMEQKMAMKMTIQGMNIDMTMNQTIDMLQQVKSVDKDGSARVSQTFERWRMVMDTPMGKIDLDSNDPKESDNPLGKALLPMLKSMKGAEFAMTMSPLGEFKDVKVPEAFLKVVKGDGGVPGLGDMFSEEGLKRMMSQSGLILTKEAVSKGKSWENKTDLKMPFGQMKMVQANTYEGPTKRDGKDLEKISFKIKIDLEPDPNSPLKIKLKVEEAKGSAEFDNAAGRLVAVNANQVMNMELGVMDQTISQRIETTISLRLKQ